MISTLNNNSWISADWPAPENIHAGTTTRAGGFSKQPFKHLNLAMHVGDEENRVNQNRKKIIKDLALKSEPVWLNQQHTTNIISLDESIADIPADGSMTSISNIICTIMTADCAPVLICNKSGNTIAAIHAGWRGICQGIIENAVSKFHDPSSIMIWIGPCISKDFYEVAEDVYSACLNHLNALEQAFEPQKNGKWHCDLAQMIKIILKNVGVGAIYECGLCTYKHKDLFYSYRRDGVTGRTASMIWME